MRNALSVLIACGALVAACSSPNPVVDTGPLAGDAGMDAPALVDVGLDAPLPDVTVDAPTPTVDVGVDAAVLEDMGIDAAADDAAVIVDAGHDAAVIADAGHDAAVIMDAGHDAASPSCAPHTFMVTSDGSSYSVDGVAANPTLTLCDGVTYTFNLTGVLGFHPMGLYVSGGPPAVPVATLPQGMTTSYTVSAPFPTIYRCTVHNFGGNVTVP